MKQIRSKTGVRQMMKGARSEWNSVELVFLLQDWTDPYNVGGLFRVADACGAVEVICAGRTPVPPHPQISVTSLGNHRRVAFRQFDRYDDAAATLRSEGYSLVAVEVAEGAEHYMRYPYPPKVCLVLGNEQTGVYGSVMKQCDGAVFIPMGGKGRSLNVHVAAAVVAFEVLLGAGE